VEAIGGAEGVMNVRIFNSTGTVVYSADKNTSAPFSIKALPCA